MSKYRNIKTVIHGITFDSKKESERYLYLLAEEQQGRIKDLVCQPKFLLIERFTYRGHKIRPTHYYGDFQYIENGEIVVEDVKSKATKTKVFMLKAKLMKLKYPEIDFRIVR